MNKPYVKKYENGILVNPITKEKPYNSGLTTKREKSLENQVTRKVFKCC